MKDMNDNIIGYFASSLAGHDKATVYIIMKEDGDNVYLADGRLKTVDNLKKKKKRHIQIIKKQDAVIKSKITNNKTVTNEDIKYAIKQLINN